MSGIFISYRREDTGGAAGRLYDRLCDRFGSGRVFRDVDTIAPGERFARKIDEKLAGTDVLIALIGREWITSAGEDGRSRLHDADDFVRLEIGTALRRGIPVIPALVENAQMPRAEELPADLAPLAQCQAIEIDDAAFHEDVGRLISVLVPRVGPEESGRESPGWRRTAVLAAVTVLTLAAVVFAVTRFGGEDAADLRSGAAVLSADQVAALIIERGFFSARTNPAGGIAHDYRQDVSDGAALVIDAATGLTWEHGGSGGVVQGGRAGAAAYVQSLNGRQLGGFGDWRLPTLEEALSLLSAERHGDFHLDPTFAAVGAPFIWTLDDEAEGRGWVVYYLDGYAASEILAFNAYVRAVRSR